MRRSLRDDDNTREGKNRRVPAGGGGGGDGGLALLVSSAAGVAFHSLPPEGTVVLGRVGTCDIPIDDESLSRRHAAIHVEGGAVSVEDLGSTNGTHVNGVALPRGQRQPLAIGAGVELGDVTVVLQRASRALGGVAEKPARNARTLEGDVIIHDPATARLFKMLDVIAPSMLPVLVLGETGAGKEVFAEAVHRGSPRVGAPYLRLNCAALPESVLEGELFGYERGAFTGAVQAKPGLFESAHGGTVFLDEVGELNLQTQAKLLRLLESGEVMRLGSLRPKVVDVRFISATNRDLEQRVIEGTFRSDLFFRLNGVSITLPPLRERGADILPLAEMFAARACAKVGRPVPEIDAAARAALVAYPWPGNIRELRNVIERAVLLARGHAVGVEALGLAPAPRATMPPSAAPIVASSPPRPVPGVPGVPGVPAASLRSEVHAVEKQKILDALDQCAGNQSRAAQMLGIGRRTLIDKLDAYGLPRPRKAQPPKG